MFKTTTKECYRFQIPASGSRPRPVAHICLLQAVVFPTDEKGNATGAGCLLDLRTSVAAFPQLTFQDVCQKLKVDKAFKNLYNDAKRRLQARDSLEEDTGLRQLSGEGSACSALHVGASSALSAAVLLPLTSYIAT